MKESVLKASFWSFLTEISTKAITPLVFLLMTKLLAPKDFGIVAVATSFLGIIFILVDMGMSKTIIQIKGEKEYLDRVYSTVFIFNLIFGFFLFILIFIFSKKLAIVLGAKEASGVIKVMSVQVMFNALSSIQNALKVKELNFKQLFNIRLVTTIIPALISIPLAYLGFGYWAIIWGNVVGSIGNSLMTWKLSQWRPVLIFDKVIFLDLLSNSIWAIVETSSTWIPMFLDSFLISRYLNVEKLGLYTTSRSIHNLVITIFLAPFIPVMYSSLAKIKNDKNEFRNRILIFNKNISFISITIGFIFFAFSKEIEFLVFNEKWKGISEIFKIVFLVLGFEYFATAARESLRAKGCFKILGMNTMWYVIISIPILFIFAKINLISYVWVRCLLLFLQFPIIFINLKKEIGIRFYEYFYSVKSVFVYFLVMTGINGLMNLLVTNYDLNFFLRVIFIGITLTFIVLKEFRINEILFKFKNKN